MGTVAASSLVEEVDAVRRAVVLVLVLVALAGPAAADEGPWGWPLPGSPSVARPFAPPESRYGAGHRGVDLVSSPGAVVLAAGAGRVSFAGMLAGRGVVVVVHGALRTTYEPVVATVGVGSSVAAGEVIGTLEPGHLGCPAAACLHWGLRRGEQYLDPMRLVTRGPVRLLPVGADRVAAARPAPPPVINAGVPRFSGAREVREDGVDQGAARAAEAGAAAGPGGAPPPVAEPSWSLRAAEAPLGMAAVAALVLGIALLARPRTDPPGPASGGAAAPAVRSVVPDDLDRPDALLLDLDDARLRRDAS